MNEKKHCCASEAQFLRLLPWQEAFSLWCRKGKTFCQRAFALHRWQNGKDKENVEFAPTWQNVCGRPCLQFSSGKKIIHYAKNHKRNTCCL